MQVFGLLIDTDHRDVGGMVRYVRETGAHDVLFGLHYGRGDADGGNYWNDGGNRGFLMTTVDRSASNLTVYALDRWQVRDKLLLELGAQGVEAKREVVNIDAATGAVRSPHGSFSHVTPRAGLIYSASDGVDLFASVSGLYEPPTNFELEDEATGSNAILEAMSGTVLEIGTRGRRDGTAGKQLYWEASLYYASIDDEILSIDDPNAPGTSLSANIDRTTHAGIEAAFGAELPVGNGSALAPRLSLAINDFVVRRRPGLRQQRPAGRTRLRAARRAHVPAPERLLRGTDVRRRRRPLRRLHEHLPRRLLLTARPSRRLDAGALERVRRPRQRDGRALTSPWSACMTSRRPMPKC